MHRFRVDIGFRVRLHQRPGALGRLLAVVAQQGGLLGEVTTARVGEIGTVRDITIETSSDEHTRRVMRAVRRLENVELLHPVGRIADSPRGGLRLVYNDDKLTPVNGIARGPSAVEIAGAIRAGRCPNDRFFDWFLPHGLRRASDRHWTPLAVALRAAHWLNEAGIKSVVDLGSGAGKFCVAAALASRCSFTGIEHRSRLVEAARALAQRFGVDDRVRFIRAPLTPDAIPAADAYYLYNPFGENLFAPDARLGDEVELSRERYERDVALVETFLERAPFGTCVIKYNGFGGRMPAAYEEIAVDREMPNVLRLWRKTRDAGARAD
jgi:hypothetical protein